MKADPPKTSKPAEPTESQLHSACLSYRDDYEIIDESDQRLLRFEAVEWFVAWQKVGFFAAIAEAKKESEMAVSIETTLTDWDWCEESRPKLIISADMLSALLEVGAIGKPEFVNFKGGSREDLADQFAGMAELFQAAAKLLRGDEEDKESEK